MKAIQIYEPGGVEALEYQDVPDPVLQRGQVLIKIEATSINHVDLFIRRGGFPVPLPYIPGFEAAGTVIDANGTGFTNGQRVVGYARSGTYAELIALPSTSVFALPGSISFEQAAAAGLVYFTAWGGLVELGMVQAGQRVLVQGGGSAIGIAAVQIAKLMGAWVATSAGSDEKAERLHEMGADLALNHKTNDLLQVLMGATGMCGVDAVLEIVGTTLNLSLMVCKPHGRIIVVGHLGGTHTDLNLNSLTGKQITIAGSGSIDLAAESKGRLLQSVAAGHLNPVIDAVLPLAQAREGHARLEKGEAFGKIILKP